MALVVKDRVRETSTSTGTGTIILNGAVSGFQGFSVIGDGNTTYYTIVDAATGAWEVGIGTYTLTGATLSRDSVLESSNAGNKVDFAAGTKDVFCTYPAERSVYVEGSTITPAVAATLPVANGGSGATTLTGYLKGNGASAFTASSTIPNTDISGLGTMSTQNANGVAITGGTINDTAIGGTTPAAGAFTSVTASLPSVISVNSSSDALRITQVGSGNALVVEDSANPDASPFVVDANGQVVVGNTTAIAGQASQIFSLQVHGTGYNSAREGIFRWSANANPSGLEFYKSRGGIGTQTVVQSGDGVGEMQFAASDGTGFIPAARILVEVDGTPGTNDMPGRLVFSTTADGASSPTERMRITSFGGVGISTTPGADSLFVVGGTYPSGNGYSFPDRVLGTIPSTSTTGAVLRQTNLNTQAAAFTLPFVYYNQVSQASIGAGSTVINQMGYMAEGNLTGATNNFGFYSNIASGTGRWNFYAAGSAANYFAGNVLIGTTTATDALTLNGSMAMPAATTETRAIEIGKGRTGNGNSFIDFVSDATYTDYGLRIIRNNTGANANSEIIHRGTGNFDFNAAEAAPILLKTSGSERIRIKSTGQTRFVPLSADPSGAEAGDVYYNSSTNKLKVYNGTSWVDLH